MLRSRGLRTFLTRGQTQESPLAQITVAVLSAQESQRLFGVPLARRSIQPVFLRIVNRHSTPLRLYLLDIDPHYYTPLEAAGINHFSVLKRLSAFGIAAAVGILFGYYPARRASLLDPIDSLRYE